ncbi:PREDICTED: kappaPI-actitoxin-Avd3b-like isoform X2 [Diuraphis noxia]|uniref:kappaPI-actitoxin-Avd3b-like isoform X2 n=1 Tax=Diuraphis noxia TaxID=143948 RepID=UPI0007636478|nr:PREDICTED: kappaPI-actitoxin-Avd3b-like isoform X2 [Diuraphis noxia]
MELQTPCNINRSHLIRALVFRPKYDRCFLPPDEGNCGNRLTLRVKYYFDSTNDDCSEFIYFGCGGNDNRFDTFEECENTCIFYGF